MPKPTPKPGFKLSPAPPLEALEYFEKKKIKPGFDYRDVWREEHAVAFTVAKAMSLDILATFKEELQVSISEGKTFHQFKKELTPVLQKQGWWGVKEMVDPKTGERRLVQLGSPRRLKVIYRANIRTAHAAGQWERAERNKAALPYLMYELGPSREHRPEHAAWAGKVLPIDDPWWSTHMPPNGWGCKCRVRQISGREAKRRGGPHSPPPIRHRRWKNKRTGQTELVPRGIDPGWDTNPGKVRMAGPQKVIAEKEAIFEATFKQPPPPRQRLWAEDDNPVFSTVSGIDQEGIENKLASIPGAEAEVNALAAFLHKYKTKTLVLKQNEISRSRAAMKIAPAVGKFVGPPWDKSPTMAFISWHPRKTNGFTHKRYNHVVVKARAADSMGKAKPENLPVAIEKAIESNKADNRYWSVTASVQRIDQGTTAMLSTFTHEMGHQVHFKAGMPPIPPGFPALTLYSSSNPAEWHAEHFAAWVFNRKALMSWNEDVVKYFDELVAKVLNK